MCSKDTYSTMNTQVIYLLTVYLDLSGFHNYVLYNHSGISPFFYKSKNVTKYVSTLWISYFIRKCVCMSTLHVILNFI